VGNQPLNEKRRVMFLDPRVGWTEQETADARLKLESVWTEQPALVSENRLQLRFDRGGWNDAGSEQLARLGGTEQGLVFTVKPRQGETQAFIEVTSVRFVDDQVAAQLLEGMQLFSSDLRPLSSPLQAADRFCLPASQADVFYQRVRAHNGQITEGTADLHDMRHKATVRIPQIVQELENLCDMSRQVIDRIAEQGVQTDAPSVGERAAVIRQLRTQATGLLSELHEEQTALEAAGNQIEAQGRAAAYVEHAERWMSRIEQLNREHTSYEAQLQMRIQESLSSSLPGAQAPTSTRRRLLEPVVEHYTQAGYDARLTKDGMAIMIGDKVMVLAEKPAALTPEQQQAAEEIPGRMTATRGQRTL